MKYPQLVSMPEAVRCWLEEQLEARGIDSAVYSRYLFSLLQQKSLDEIPTQELRRGRKRGHRNYAVDLEQQKRSAILECLMSASDQKSGIEALVDELCAKLKVVQSEATINNPQEPVASIQSTAPVQNTLSYRELEQKYFSAFPPLISKPSAEIITASDLPNSSVWNGKKILGSSFGKNQTVSSIGNKDKLFASINKWEEENKENQVLKEDDGCSEKMRSRSMVKQQVTQKVRKNMAKSLDRKDEMVKLKLASDGGKTRRLDVANDAGLTRLLSKFDCDMKALWATEKPSDDLRGCDEDLPMDFQQLLDSPEKSDPLDNLQFELYKNINNKKNVVSSYGCSFIQCGTNITSSIWSEKSDGLQITTDCSMIGSDNGADHFNNSLLNSESGRSVWSNIEDDENKNVVKNESSEQWSNGDDLFFSYFSGGEGFNVKLARGVKGSKWSDIESTSLRIDSRGKFYSSFENSIGISLSQLNHNKEDSCFMEFVPAKVSRYERNVQLKRKCAKNIAGPEGMCEEVQDDEDLLTSMRTHFQPINAKEVSEQIESQATPSAPRYADGTTFHISNSLDKPSFMRSESGAFYLDSDEDLKYREFSDSSFEAPGRFIPKFKVCQNEKFCQTEDIPKLEDTDSEFYFPGDEQQAEDCLEKDSNTPCITVDGWVAAWPAGIWSNNTPQPWCDVWNAEVKVSEGKEDGDHYMQLRDEILEEGEELLSDLSSMQRLLLNGDEALPVPPSSQCDSDYLYKSSTIPLPSSEMGQKFNERHFSLKVSQKEPISKRQPLTSIPSWTGPVVI